MHAVTIRPAQAGDAPLVATFINELAEFEKLADHARPSAEKIERQLDGVRPAPIFCFIAEVDGEPVGFALAFLAYSTFLGDFFVHLEDLYVREAARGYNIGHSLFVEVCRVGLERDLALVKLDVLNWNESAIKRYERWHGERDNEWSQFRFDRAAMEAAVRS